MVEYAGPLRNEPLAIELHNTLYAAGGQTLDGLEDDAAAAAWLRGLEPRLPVGGRPGRVARAQLIAARGTVRDALHAAVEDRAVTRECVARLNLLSARAPAFTSARWRQSDAPLKQIDYRTARREDVVISALAADAIDLITGPQRSDIHACGARGCVLLYLKDHPRQGWCSAACGNRARQARHYHRTHTDPGHA